MKTNLFLLAIMLLWGCQIKSQVFSEYKQLPLLAVENQEIIPLLDNSTEFFDQIDTKSDSLYFIIRTHKRPEQNFKILHIESNEHRDAFFDDYDDPIGFFYYRNYLFVVYDKESEEFFSQTDIKKRFYYDPPAKDKLQVIDDSHPYWVYYYNNGIFNLLGQSIPDEYKPQPVNKLR